MLLLVVFDIGASIGIDVSACKDDGNDGENGGGGGSFEDDDNGEDISDDGEAGGVEGDFIGIEKLIALACFIKFVSFTLFFGCFLFC